VGPPSLFLGSRGSHEDAKGTKEGAGNYHKGTKAQYGSQRGTKKRRGRGGEKKRERGGAGRAGA